MLKSKSIRIAGAVAGLVTAVALAAGCAANSPQAPNADAYAHGLHCSGSDFKVDLTVQPPLHDASPNAHFLVAVTNVSNHTCTVNGYVDLTGMNAAAYPVPVNVQDVTEPGPPVNVTLAPGRSAFAGMTLAPGDPNEDPVITSFNATVPSAHGSSPTVVEAADGTPAEDEPDPSIAVNWIQIGTLQPSPEGVYIN